MNFHTEGAFKAGGYVSLPVFTGENKKESVYAARINSFYGDICAKAEEICQKKGLKCYIDSSVTREGDDYTVTLKMILRYRARTVFSHTHTALWSRAAIKKDLSAVRQRGPNIT